MLSARRAERDRARVPQDPQLLRHGRLGHAGAGDQIGDRPLPVPEGVEQPPPRWIGEEPKDIGHGTFMLK